MQLLSLPSVPFLVRYGVLFVFHSTALPHIIKQIAIWGVRWPDVWGDVVAEIFSQRSPACVASSHCLNLGLQEPLQVLDVDLHVESEAMREDEWRHNVIIECDHSKHHGSDRMLVFFFSLNINLFSDWHPKSEIFPLDLPAWMPLSISNILYEWIVSWWCFLYRQCPPDTFAVQ